VRYPPPPAPPPPPGLISRFFPPQVFKLGDNLGPKRAATFTFYRRNVDVGVIRLTDCALPERASKPFTLLYSQQIMHQLIAFSITMTTCQGNSIISLEFIRIFLPKSILHSFYHYYAIFVSLRVLNTFVCRNTLLFMNNSTKLLRFV
jgi:hypothetical protein